MNVCQILKLIKTRLKLETSCDFTAIANSLIIFLEINFAVSTIKLSHVKIANVALQDEMKDVHEIVYAFKSEMDRVGEEDETKCTELYYLSSNQTLLIKDSKEPKWGIKLPEANEFKYVSLTKKISKLKSKRTALYKIRAIV